MGGDRGGDLDTVIIGMRFILRVCVTAGISLLFGISLPVLKIVNSILHILYFCLHDF